MIRLQVALVSVGFSLLIGAGASAQQLASARTNQELGNWDESWYYQQPQEPQQPSPRSIVQQKAQFRAQQRMARLAAMNWYGLSNARPRANPTPFGSLYSPRWQTPGGRPFAWYPRRQPTVVVIYAARDESFHNR